MNTSRCTTEKIKYYFNRIKYNTELIEFFNLFYNIIIIRYVLLNFSFVYFQMIAFFKHYFIRHLNFQFNDVKKRNIE